MSTFLRPFLFIFFCAAIAFSLFQYEENRRDENAARDAGEEMPEFFLDQSVTTRYNKDGSIHYQITGEHLEYFKSTDIVQVMRPYFVLHSKDGHNWHTRADHATLLGDNKGIQLKGAVRAWQPERNVELTTDELFLIPEKEYAETSKAVIIRSVSGVTQGIGMVVDLQAETMAIRSAVKGTYVVK